MVDTPKGAFSTEDAVADDGFVDNHFVWLKGSNCGAVGVAKVPKEMGRQIVAQAAEIVRQGTENADLRREVLGARLIKEVVAEAAAQREQTLREMMQELVQAMTGVRRFITVTRCPVFDEEIAKVDAVGRFDATLAKARDAGFLGDVAVAVGAREGGQP